VHQTSWTMCCAIFRDRRSTISTQCRSGAPAHISGDHSAGLRRESEFHSDTDGGVPFDTTILARMQIFGFFSSDRIAEAATGRAGLGTPRNGCCRSESGADAADIAPLPRRAPPFGCRLKRVDAVHASKHSGSIWGLWVGSAAEKSAANRAEACWTGCADCSAALTAYSIPPAARLTPLSLMAGRRSAVYHFRSSDKVGGCIASRGFRGLRFQKPFFSEPGVCLSDTLCPILSASFRRSTDGLWRSDFHQLGRTFPNHLRRASPNPSLSAPTRGRLQQLAQSATRRWLSPPLTEAAGANGDALP
jgi:hypothetical protein